MGGRNLFDFIQYLLLILLAVSGVGYILATLREKVYMKNNIIVIDNKNLTVEDLKEIDINEFILKGKRVRSGDELKIITLEKEKLNGTLIGGNKSNESLHMITSKDKVKKLRISKILRLKIVSKYGKFFNY